MNSLNHTPKKIKFLLEFSFPTINKIFPRKKFIGGRIGYPKDLIFKWLLVKKTTNWDFRTVEELSGISHQTLIRRNQQFLVKDIYQKFFVSLVRKAVKIGLIVGEKVAMDSTFYKYRTEIERFFSTVKRKFYLGKEFTRGIEVFAKNTYLALISYCLREFYVVGIRSF